MSDQRHRIQVDYSERQAPLLELLRQSGAFDVRIVRLTVGDYLINDEVLIERKTIADFSASLVDGRLFPQAARLARDGHRTLMLIEGPPAASMPDVHPHAIQGALVSLAAMWRLPVLHTCDAADSFRVDAVSGGASQRLSRAHASQIRPKAEAIGLSTAVSASGLAGSGSSHCRTTVESAWLHTERRDSRHRNPAAGPRRRAKESVADSGARPLNAGAFCHLCDYRRRNTLGALPRAAPSGESVSEPV